MHTANSKKRQKQSVPSFPKRLWQKTAVICDTDQKLTNTAAQRKKKKKTTGNKRQMLTKLDLKNLYFMWTWFKTKL